MRIRSFRSLSYTIVVSVLACRAFGAQQYIFSAPASYSRQAPNDACKSHRTGFITVGNTLADPVPMNEQEIFLLEVDDGGNQLLWRAYGGEDLWYNGYGICPTSNGGYAIAGSRGPVPSIPNPLLILADGRGTLTAEYVLSPPPPFPSGGLIGWAFDVIETRDGNLIVYGETQTSGIFCMSIDPADGSTDWYYHWGGAPESIPAYTYSNCALETHTSVGDYVLLALTQDHGNRYHKVVCIDNDSQSIQYGEIIGTYDPPC